MSFADVEIGVAPPDRQTRALWLALASLPAEERTANLNATLVAAKAGQTSLADLWEARRGPQLVGAVWGAAMPGRQAVVWPAGLVPDESEFTAAALHERLEASLAVQDVRMYQSLVAQRGGVETQRLVAAGFQHVADLQYLVCTTDRLPVAAPHSALAFECFEEKISGAARIARIADETYRDTLDCPRLNGVRDMDDVLAGYRQTGEFAPERWLIVRHENRDVGCLLLADHPLDDQWELVYMGIVPAARGRGFGFQITRHAQWLTRCAGRQRLILAVDAANEPAIAMYSAAGFQLWNLRSAFVKTLPGAAGK